MKMWMKWIMFFTVCQHTLCIDQPYRLVDANTTCLEIKVESRLSCNNRSQFYHCLLDENYTKEFEVCRNWKWIPEEKCAYFNTYGRGNVDERNCEGNATQKCATVEYLSNSSMQYNACYVKKRITPPIITVTTVRSTGRGTSDVRNTTETAPTESTPAESQFNSSAMGIALGVLVPLILLVVVPGILLFRKRRHSQGTSQRETAVERGEGDALMNTETKYLAENKQNQHQIEKDERTSTDDKKTLPLLAENKNENQSEGCHDATSTSKRETTMQNGEREAPRSKGTNCQEENEHKELQIQKDTSKGETTMGNAECKALESTETKYMEEKEQNQQQIEQNTSKSETTMQNGKALVSTGSKRHEENGRNQ